MSAEQTKKEQAPVAAPVIAVDCFGHAFNPSKHPGLDLHVETMKQYGWKMDHEHARKTVDTETVEDLNLYALTQAYKTECGMELMKTLLKTGQASPEDFLDDGTLSGDDTLPKDINTLNEALAQENVEMSKVIKGLGGDFGDAVRSGNVEEYIKGLINAQIAAQQAAVEKPAEGEYK